MATLKEFIKETLSEITDAMIEFADEKGDTGACPHPDGLHIPKGAAGQKFMYAEAKVDGVQYNDVVAIIDFDVAVTVAEESKKKGGVGIRVLSAFSAEVGAETANIGTSVSRMKFAVPLRLPKVEQKTKRQPQPKINVRNTRRIG